MKRSIFGHIWQLFCAYVVGFYASLVNRLEIRGHENIPDKGGILLLANHISAYDTVFLPWAVLKNFPSRTMWAPAKKELFKNPVISLLMTSMGAFPVARGRDTKASGIINELLQKDIVMLFPEGTRNKEGKLGEGNRGVGKIIFEANPVVIPVALIELNKWPFPSLLKKGRIIFGKPLDFRDLLGKEITKETYRTITDRVMAEISRLLNENSTG